MDIEPLAGESVCYLTTRGRRSGRPHRIEIWFGAHQGVAYLLSGGGERSDWVRNLLADPEVHLEVAGHEVAARARVVEDPEEETTARRLLATKYQGWHQGRAMSRWATTALPVAIEPAAGPGA